MSSDVSPEVVLHGPVTEAVIAALRAGKEPDVADLKARFPDVADRIDGFVRELIQDARLFHGVVRREIIRALEWYLASVRAGELPDGATMQSRHPLLPEGVRERAFVVLAEEVRAALWLPRELTGE